MWRLLSNREEKYFKLALILLEIKVQLLSEIRGFAKYDIIISQNWNKYKSLAFLLK